MEKLELLNGSSSAREAYAYYMGQILKDVRKNEKLTQKELAQRVGVHKSYISKIEKGIIEPDMTMFFRIASALGRTVELIPTV